MIELVGSMLVPLEGTLPGWPEAPAPNILWTLMLCLGFPLAIGAIVTFLTMRRQLVSSARDNGLAQDDQAIESERDDRRALESSSNE